MPWIICFPVKFVTLASGRPVPIEKQICIRIPILIDKFKIDPEPDPWIKSDLLKPRLVKDLQILATIDTLAEGLSSGLKGRMQEAIRGLVDVKQELPAEMKLNFDKK